LKRRLLGEEQKPQYPTNTVMMKLLP